MKLNYCQIGEHWLCVCVFFRNSGKTKLSLHENTAFIIRETFIFSENLEFRSGIFNVNKSEFYYENRRQSQKNSQKYKQKKNEIDIVN